MKGYVKYQTFNEYKLEGVNSSHIKNPYVFVKKELDTVFVIKSNDRRSVMTYINKGEYWFYQEPEEIQKGFIDKVLSKSIWKIFSHPKGVDKTLSKKFITNDTIFIFSYLIMPGTDRGITDAGIIIETPETETIIGNYKIIFENDDDLYKTIRNITSDYEDSIPYYEKGQVFPNGYYQTYIKVFKDNLLYLYDSKNRNKPVYVYKLNNLGEFDFKNAEDIHLYPR